MDERFRGSVSHAYQAFHGELLRFLRKHLGSSADAADLAQDTFAHDPPPSGLGGLEGLIGAVDDGNHLLSHSEHRRYNREDG